MLDLDATTLSAWLQSNLGWAAGLAAAVQAFLDGALSVVPFGLGERAARSGDHQRDRGGQAARERAQGSTLAAPRRPHV